MNSHAKSGNTNISISKEYLELSGILSLHPEGDVFYPAGLENLQNIQFQPVDLEKMRADYVDENLGRRVSPRYGLRVTVLICNHLKAFRTQTENISASGLLMKDQLPEAFFKGFFDVVLIHESAPGKKEYLLFRGKAVSAARPSRRVAFEACGEDAQAKFLELTADLTPLCAA